MMNKILLLMTGALTLTGVNAQLSTNPDKFLGNITTRGQVNGTGYEYSSLWNQITPENESKWQSCEYVRDVFTWDGCDRAYNYAREHNFPFKFHTFVWGSQYPEWMNNLSKQEQYEEVVEWIDAIKERYPDLEMIDVVNEAITGHAPAPFKDALGGDGVTGYDWIIKAFELAAERWPDAILIYNDYNTFQWQKTEFINLVKTLRNAGAPIDAYGCQSHDLTDIDFSTFKASMIETQEALQMPMYSTEYDIGTTDDDKQKKQYEDQIKYMWEQDYVAGITLWGFIYGATWTTDGNSGIIRDGEDRPAMTWLREYMATDAAKTAKSPFPGMKKEASLYVKPQSLNITIGESATVDVTARLATKKAEKVELYADGELIKTMTAAPYTAEFTPGKLGKVTFKAILYTTDGNKYERISEVKVNSPRKPYKEMTIPGTIEAEYFDMGADGVSFHDSNDYDEGDAQGYRTDSGIDIVKDGNGYCVGYTNTGEWMEYTVEATEEGYYEYELVASAGQDGALVSIYLHNDELKPIATDIKIRKDGWNVDSSYFGRLPMQLAKGKNIFRITIANTGCNVEKLVMKHVVTNDNLTIELSDKLSSLTVSDDATISLQTVPDGVKSVSYYADGLLIGTVDASPYTVVYKAKTVGNVVITAVAADADGKLSNVASRTVKVGKKRSPFNGAIAIPGVLEAENFDKGGEGTTFHDSDSEDEGGAHYRTDNEGVDIGDGNTGYVLGYTAADEWYEYTVDVRVAGDYNIEVGCATGSDYSGFKLSLADGGVLEDISDDIRVNNTGGWGEYIVHKAALTKKLTVGEHTFRITITSPYLNIDFIKFISNAEDGIEEIFFTEDAVYEVYTLTGLLVGKVEAAGLSAVKQSARTLVGRKGIYIIRNASSGKATKMVF